MTGAPGGVLEGIGSYEGGFASGINSVCTFTSQIAHPKSVTGGPEMSAAMILFDQNLALGQRPVEAFYNAYAGSVAKNQSDVIYIAELGVSPKVQWTCSNVASASIVWYA